VNFLAGAPPEREGTTSVVVTRCPAPQERHMLARGVSPGSASKPATAPIGRNYASPSLAPFERWNKAQTLSVIPTAGRNLLFLPRGIGDCHRLIPSSAGAAYVSPGRKPWVSIETCDRAHRAQLGVPHLSRLSRGGTKRKHCQSFRPQGGICFSCQGGSAIVIT